MNSSTESEKQITQLQQENELLLLQLHQVQEELEHYFLMSREYETKNLALQTSNHSNGGSCKDSLLFVKKPPKNLARILQRIPQVKKSILRNSNFFDEAWYLQTYPDVAKKRKDPVSHYLRHGAKEGRNPGPQFDTQWYLANNRDVAEKGVNPLLHYIQFGQTEGRQPRPGGIQPPQDPFASERKRLTQARNEQARLASERQHRIEQLTQANEAARKQAKESQNQIGALTQERDEQEQIIIEQLQQIEQLTVAKEEAQQQISEYQSLIAILTQERDEQSQFAVERLKQIEQLTIAKEEAHQQISERQNLIAALIQERDEQSQRAAKLQQRLSQLECQLADTETRQSMLNEEMIKAEAQIDLIKEMLFEERGRHEPV